MTYDQQYKIAWLGFHQEGMDAFSGILKAGFNIEAVITLDEESSQLRSASVSYSGLCEEYGIPLYKIKNINDPDAITILKKLDLDILFVIGWSQIVRKEAMACVNIGLIGAHASLLPHNRGSAPVNWAIINGEDVTGNTLIWLTEDVDNGDIIAQRKFDITLYDTCKTIYEKVATSNRDMILDFLGNSVQKLPASIKQKNIDEPLLARRRPKDGLINWNQPARKVYDFIRALAKPYPGGFTHIKAKKMFIWEAAFFPDISASTYKAGQVIGSIYSPNDYACALMVACQQGAIAILHMEDEAGNIYRGRTLSGLDYKGLEFCNE